jgi:hypothetical protein
MPPHPQPQLTAARSRDEQSKGWAKLWENNESDLWDRGRPSSALVTFLEEHPYRETLFRDRSKRQLKAFMPVGLYSRKYTAKMANCTQGLRQGA